MLHLLQVIRIADGDSSYRGNIKASLHTLESRWLQLTFPNGIPQGSVAQSPNLFRYMFDDLLHGFGHSGIPGLLDYPDISVTKSHMNKLTLSIITYGVGYLYLDPINHPFTPTVLLLLASDFLSRNVLLCAF